jgi:lysophospholipase L1-like esterase
MPAHRVRAVGYTFAGLAVAATLLIVGPPSARALARSRSAAVGSVPSAAASSPSPVSASQAPTPAPSVSPSPSPSRSGPYRVVGLGDSVPSGYACGCTSYVSLTGRHEAAQVPTTAAVSNLAEPGLTTSGLLDQLKETSVRRRIAAADLVIITIGANDFDTGSVADASCRGPGLDCFRSTLDQQASQLRSVFKEVDRLLGNRPATVLVTGYWNVFLDGDVAVARGADYVRNSNALTVAENAQIAKIGRAQGDTYVDIYTPFKGTSGTKDDTFLLAADGDHPNAAGHRKIAKALESAL